MILRMDQERLHRGSREEDLLGNDVCRYGSIRKEGGEKMPVQGEDEEHAPEQRKQIEAMTGMMGEPRDRLRSRDR